MKHTVQRYTAVWHPLRAIRICGPDPIDQELILVTPRRKRQRRLAVASARVVPHGSRCRIPVVERSGHKRLEQTCRFSVRFRAAGCCPWGRQDRTTRRLSRLDRPFLFFGVTKVTQATTRAPWGETLPASTRVSMHPAHSVGIDTKDGPRSFRVHRILRQRRTDGDHAEGRWVLRDRLIQPKRRRRAGRQRERHPAATCQGHLQPVIPAPPPSPSSCLAGTLLAY
jgi:hypothetical protein